jgi:hypothetical protein
MLFACSMSISNKADVIHVDPVNLQVNHFYLKFRKILSLKLASETASALESMDTIGLSG